MKFLFRVDASLDIGAGHVMRCLTLADALTKAGARCIFVSKEHHGNLLEFIRKRGFTAHGIRVSQSADQRHDSADAAPLHSEWLGGTWEDDVVQMLGLLRGETIDWLVVDHYALDHRWESEARKACTSLMVIDDLADRIHSCDLLLDQNLGRDPSKYSSLVPRSCVSLVGPKYALLRPEFAALRSASLSRRPSGVLRQILVTMGGVDKHNATGNVLAALDRTGLPRACKVIIVLGSTAPWFSEVRRQASHCALSVEVCENVENMADLMMKSDLAIGAAGGTSWERCCLGLPTLLLCLADNQKEVFEELVKSGAAQAIDKSLLLPGRKLEFAESLSEFIDRRQEYGMAASRIVDGLGIDRVLQVLAP